MRSVLGMSRGAEGLRPGLQENSVDAPLLLMVRKGDIDAIKILPYSKGSPTPGIKLVQVVFRELNKKECS